MNDNNLKDYIHVIKVDFITQEFLETVKTCKNHKEAREVTEEYNASNNFTKEVEYTFSNETAKDSKKERAINK